MSVKTVNFGAVGFHIRPQTVEKYIAFIQIDKKDLMT